MPDGWEWWLLAMITINTVFNVFRYFEVRLRKKRMNKNTKVSNDVDYMASKIDEEDRRRWMKDRYIVRQESERRFNDYSGDGGGNIGGNAFSKFG